MNFPQTNINHCSFWNIDHQTTLKHDNVYGTPDDKYAIGPQYAMSLVPTSFMAISAETGIGDEQLIS